MKKGTHPTKETREKMSNAKIVKFPLECFEMNDNLAYLIGAIKGDGCIDMKIGNDLIVIR